MRLIFGVDRMGSNSGVNQSNLDATFPEDPSLEGIEVGLAATPYPTSQYLPVPIEKVASFQEAIGALQPSASSQALFNAGIHSDNARNTLQILSFEGSDRPAILKDVAQSITRAEREISHSSHGSVRGSGNGNTATYDYHHVRIELANMRQQLMRELRALPTPERVAILHLMNPHNQS